MNDQEDILVKMEEETLKFKAKHKKHSKESEEDEDSGLSKVKPFNELGLQNLVNLHDHISRMIQEKSKSD